MPDVEPWRVIFHRRAQKDNVLLARAGLRAKAQELIDLVRRDPFETPPAFEKLTADMAGAYSRRLTLQHRMVYFVVPELREVRILRMWTHYE